ncbi:M23 family metallopeptidase [Endozoicomonas sp. OPT23]|uniref:M23 family metallopeptidase n=1 Tax=Endozoicomonas sp. OPT23 TaxID=2072845 RepID=UPI001E5C9C48|nr:M23 family metallopeptidase [Endozoicomonas sp. OPT23]
MIFSLQLQAKTLQSRLIQGGFHIGKVQPHEDIIYKGQSVRVDETGRFIIGFGRDASLKQSYIVRSGLGQQRQVDLKLEKRDYKVQRIKGVARKYVTPPERVLKRIRNDNRQVKEARKYDTEYGFFFKGFLRPAEGPVSGVYGSQRYFNGKPRRPHFGLDIAGPVGAGILAPAAGVVRLAESDMYYSGGTLIIDHGAGISSSFLHLSKLNVKAGQKVKRGEVVAEMGATGRVTGPHLDWRINWFDVRMDPALMLIE